MSASSSRSGGGARRVELAQLRRAAAARARRRPRRPLAAAERHVPASRSHGRARGPELSGVAPTPRSGSPRRDADDPPLVALQHGDDLRQRLDASQRAGSLRHDDGEAARELAAAPRVAGHLAAERRRDLADEGERAVQGQPAPRPRGREPCEALVDPRSRLRPDPGHAVEPACRGRFAQLRQRPDPERVPDLAHPLRRDAEQRRNADELRQRLRLQLVQLGDPSRLDELAQPRLDPRPDPAQLAHATLAHERSRRRRASSGSCSAARRYARTV